MSPKHDCLAMAADRELQMATLRSGWRFYERAAQRDDAQQALQEWVDAVEAVLDLGVEYSALASFRSCFATALDAATDESLQQNIRTLVAAFEPAPLGDLRHVLLSVRELLREK